jgi:Undecaprenyl-phosphate galactose phosphotransferase WbaP
VYWPVNLPVVYIGMAFTVILFSLTGLYPGYGLTAAKEIEKLIKSMTLIYASIGFFVYFFKIYSYFPRSIFVTAWLFSLFLIPAMRFFLRNRFSLLSWYGIPVIIIAEDIVPMPIYESIVQCRRMGWKVGAVFIQNQNNIGDEVLDLHYIKSMAELEDYCNRYRVNTAIYSINFAEEDDIGNKINLRSISDLIKNVVLVMPYYNLGSVWVEPHDLEGRLGLELQYHLLDPFSIFIKKIIDFIGSVFLLVILSPVFLLISIAIYLDAPGPIFYKQERLGRGYENFQAIKFRTMVKNAELQLQELLKEDLQAREEYEKYHKLAFDPRITRVGRWLRKFSLDELPQLWNVLMGDMSLVGPRAYMPAELGDMGEYANLILKVRPGLTGWWQVMGRQNNTFQSRLRMDEYYLSNWSLWLDLYIYYKTIWVVIGGTGT